MVIVEHSFIMCSGISFSRFSWRGILQIFHSTKTMQESLGKFPWSTWLRYDFGDPAKLAESTLVVPADFELQSKNMSAIGSYLT